MKVLREGWESKLSAPPPTTLNSAGSRISMCTFCEGVRGDLTLRLTSRTITHHCFSGTGFTLGQMSHEVELGLTPKCILRVLCYRQSSATYLHLRHLLSLSCPTAHSCTADVIWAATPSVRTVGLLPKSCEETRVHGPRRSEGRREPQ